MSLLKELGIDPTDVPFEKEVIAQPFLLLTWIRYLDHKQTSPLSQRIIIYERSLESLPGSYKLWKSYFTELIQANNENNGHSKRFNLIPLFERCLTLLHRMPTIWLMYTDYLYTQKHCITTTRRTFDRALLSLPLSQHFKIWPTYVQFVKKVKGETLFRVFKRFLQFEPSCIDEYYALLVSIGRIDEAIQILLRMLDERNHSYSLWLKLCDLICEQTEAITFDIEPLVRTGILRFPEHVGKLWNALARFYVYKSQFSKARAVFEEGIAKVTSVKDFTMIFDAYAEFESTLVSEKLELIEEGDTDEDEQLELDFLLAHLEDLLNRRPCLLSDVLLRQNPHSIHEWQKRIALYSDVNDDDNTIVTYKRAFKTIQPRKADGPLHSLYIDCALFYESLKDVDAARQVLESAISVHFSRVDDLAAIVIAWAEMELRYDRLDDALAVCARSLKIPSNTNPHSISFKNDSISPQKRLFKSIKLWSYYAELEEGLGTYDSIKAVYDQILYLRIATLVTLFHYAEFLQKHEYFEESWKVYERGFELFNYPVAFELWNRYLTEFYKRYGKAKIERLRDLFEQALVKCPAEFCFPIYVLYARVEEEIGFIKRSMALFERAVEVVSEEKLYDAHVLWIAKVGQYSGLPATRVVYEQALQKLAGKDCKQLLIEFVGVETKLGELERARALWAWAVELNIWEEWEKWEVEWGNEMTFRDMLRVRRSVDKSQK